MSVLLPFKPDRKIDSLFAVIVTDPDNGLQGIGSMGAAGMQMQAVSSSRETIERIFDIIRAQPWSTNFRFEIVEFVKRG